MPKMPKTDSIQDLAAFWQRHDLTDFEDELEEVPGPLFQRAHVVGVALTRDKHKALRRQQPLEGSTRQIREWVKERLHHA